MAKTGRNDPCHCGSGKKYKRCCEGANKAATSAKLQAAAKAAEEASEERARDLLEALEEQLADEDLDEASNAVVDLIHAGKLDEAEAAANDLLVRFPEVHDGHDRLGMVAEARGDKKLAASHYRKIVAFAEQNADLIDPRLIDGYRKMIDELDPPSGP